MSDHQSGSIAATDRGQGEAFDLIVLGGGVGGLTAALVGQLSGLRTLLVEKSARVGGTSARSSGTVWIPDNTYQRREGITGDAETARQYLSALMEGRGSAEMREAFIQGGPEMLAFLEERTDIAFSPFTSAVDYRQDMPGAAQGWRPLEPLPFDGRTLGSRFDEVGLPIPELVLFGGMMVTRAEVAQLLKLPFDLGAVMLGARLTLRYAMDRLRFKRGTRLVLGNALVARLYRNLIDRGGVVWLNSAPARLLVEEGRVQGLLLSREGREVRVGVGKGVVLAGGGFPAGAKLREQYLPSPTAQYTSAFEGCTGDSIELGLEAGAALGPPGEDNALWFPSSIARRKDGSTAVYPHIILDRAKPGLVAVNEEGRRFVNEGVSYHEFVRGMYHAHRRTPCIPAWLICDRAFVRKYGLGMIRPRTPFLGRFVKSGYLKTASTVAELARKIGVDPAGLEETVRLQNEFARTGVDIEFGKGENSYDRGNGDPAHGPNPCLGPIATAPFCAVAVLPTPLGTSLGILTDVHGQALGEDRTPVAGLYACGNDMHSALAGEYPGPGAQLGQAMTFGYLAARHAAGQN